MNKVKLISDDELMLKETITLEIVKQFLVPSNTEDDFSNKQYFWRIDNDFKKNSMSVDNNGNVVIINSDQKIFMINENNEWNSVITNLK